MKGGLYHQLVVSQKQEDSHESEYTSKQMGLGLPIDCDDGMSFGSSWSSSCFF